MTITWVLILVIWCFGSIGGGLLTSRWIRNIEEHQPTRKERTR